METSNLQDASFQFRKNIFFPFQIQAVMDGTIHTQEGIPLVFKYTMESVRERLVTINEEMRCLEADELQRKCTLRLPIIDGFYTRTFLDNNWGEVLVNIILVCVRMAQSLPPSSDASSPFQAKALKHRLCVRLTEVHGLLPLPAAKGNDVNHAMARVLTIHEIVTACVQDLSGCYAVSCAHKHTQNITRMRRVATNFVFYAFRIGYTQDNRTFLRRALRESVQRRLAANHASPSAFSQGVKQLQHAECMQVLMDLFVHTVVDVIDARRHPCQLDAFQQQEACHQRPCYQIPRTMEPELDRLQEVHMQLALLLVLEKVIKFIADDLSVILTDSKFCTDVETIMRKIRDSLLWGTYKFAFEHHQLLPAAAGSQASKHAMMSDFYQSFSSQVMKTIGLTASTILFQMFAKDEIDPSHGHGHGHDRGRFIAAIDPNVLHPSTTNLTTDQWNMRVRDLERKVMECCRKHEASQEWANCFANATDLATLRQLCLSVMMHMEDCHAQHKRDPANVQPPTEHTVATYIREQFPAYFISFTDKEHAPSVLVRFYKIFRTNTNVLQGYYFSAMRGAVKDCFK